jgi:hypothetical protein
MPLNIFTSERVSRLGQYDRIDDLIPFNLRGDKCPVVRQFLVDKFNSSAIFQRFDLLFVWYSRTSSAKTGV